MLTSFRRVMIVILSTVFVSTSAIAQSEILDIDPVPQNTHVWCWLAVAEMALRFFDVPNVNPAGIYQCGVVGLLSHGTGYHACSQDCSLCTFPAGNAQNLVSTIENYPKKLRATLGTQSPGTDASYSHRALSRTEIVDHIDSDEPVIAGISPSGRPAGFTSEHVAIIIGYDDDGDVLIVNDPYPFSPSVWTNPYIAAGAEILQPLQYRIDYDTFKSRLQWQESISVSRVSAQDEEVSTPNFCCTAVGRLGPYPNPGLPVGAQCYGTHPVYGPQTGRACY